MCVHLESIVCSGCFHLVKVKDLTHYKGELVCPICDTPAEDSNMAYGNSIEAQKGSTVEHENFLSGADMPHNPNWGVGENPDRRPDEDPREEGQGGYYR